MYHSSSSVFMTNKSPSGAIKHHEGTKPGARKMGEMFFFLSSSSFFFRQASSLLSQPLALVYARNSSILY